MEILNPCESLDTCHLELAYEKILRQNELIYNLEDIRNLHVQIFLLENENGDLRSQISKDEDRLDEQSCALKATQSQLDLAEGNLGKAQGELRVKNRETETLKAELNSLRGTTVDSTKLLTEKLAIARELSNLRPEIEHLRSQASSHQSLLAEKLSLQRQLENLRAEFEVEKQSTKRTLPQESILPAEEKKSENQVQELKAELKRERLEKQKLGRELQRATGDSEAQKLALQSQLEVLKDKLKSAKAQLKRAQAKVKSGEVSQETVPNKSTRNNAVAPKSRKRDVVQMESDAVIGTPGLGPETKRRKRASTLPGDKSAFSITPYLNRTASVPPESSPRQVESSDVEGGEPPSRVHNIQKGEPITSKKGHARHAASEEANQTEEWPGALENVKANKNDRKRVSTREKSSIGPVLQTVAEEEDDTSHDTSSKAPTHPQKDHKTDTENGFRKLQGSGAAKTLFDDEDWFRKGREPLEARQPPSFMNGGRIIAKPRMLLGRSSLTASFGAISPLKRDKSRSILDVSIAR